jgi:hypothetical protein
VLGDASWDEGFVRCESVFVEGVPVTETGVVEPGVYVGLLFCPSHFLWF